MFQSLIVNYSDAAEFNIYPSNDAAPSHPRHLPRPRGPPLAAHDDLSGGSQPRSNLLLPSTWRGRDIREEQVMVRQNEVLYYSVEV